MVFGKQFMLKMTFVKLVALIKNRSESLKLVFPPCWAIIVVIIQETHHCLLNKQFILLISIPFSKHNYFH